MNNLTAYLRAAVAGGTPHRTVDDLNDLLRSTEEDAYLAEEPCEGFPKEAAAKVIETVADVTGARIEGVQAVIGAETADGRALVMVYGSCSATGPDPDRPFATVMTADGQSLVGPVYGTVPTALTLYIGEAANIQGTPPESIVQAAAQAAYEEGRLMIVGRTTASPTGWRYADAEDPGAEAEMRSLGPIYKVDATGLID